MKIWSPFLKLIYNYRVSYLRLFKNTVSHNPEFGSLLSRRVAVKDRWDNSYGS